MATTAAISTAIVKKTMGKIDINYKKLIQGEYEAQRLPKGFSPEHRVPDYAFNVLNPLGLLYCPVVDDYFFKKSNKKPVWPEKKPFAVCLSHDVDAVSLYSVKQSIRKRWVQLSRAASIFQKMKIFLAFGVSLSRPAKHHGTKDPLFCYVRWIEVEKKINAHSTFFFWPGRNNVTKPHHTDCIYELTDIITFDNQKCNVAEMMREIDRRGWEIGIHPSWYTFNDLDELKRQKEAIEKAIGHEIVSIRQHYLHYDIRITPWVQAKAHFKYDSTLGFNVNVGFRFGTCYPYPLYALKEKKIFHFWKYRSLCRTVPYYIL